MAAKKPKKPNWAKIQTEYVTGNIGQRDLAKKHGVSYGVLAQRCRDEGWVAMKKEHKSKTVAKALEKISEEQSDLLSQELTGTAGELLAMVRKGIRNLDRAVRTHKEVIEQDGLTTATEWITLDQADDYVDLKAAKAAGSALRDVRDILGVKTELERQEQEARIAALRARVPEKDDEDGNRHGVVLLPAVEPLKPPEEDSDG